MSAVAFASGCGIQIRRLANLSCDPAAAPFGFGSGTADDPYLICSVSQLESVATALGASFQLTADLDLSGATGFPLGADDAAVFTGTFDGGGYTLSGLTLNDPFAASSIGFFRKFQGTLLNVTFSDFDISGNSFTGAIAGLLASSRIDRVTLSGIRVRGRGYAGGAFGRLEPGGAGLVAGFSHFSAEGIDVSSSFDGTIMNHNAPSFDRDTGVGALIGSQDADSGVSYEFAKPELRVTDSDFSDITVGTTATAGSLVSSDYAHTGGIVGLGTFVNFSNVTVRDISVTGIGNAGALIGYKDFGPTLSDGVTSASNIIDVSVTGASVTQTPRAGWSLAGGLFGRADNLIAKRVIFSGTLVSHGKNTGGFRGAGCGLTLDGAFIDIAITQDGGAYVGGVLGDDCVSVTKNVLVLGSLQAGGSYAGTFSGATYSIRTIESTLSLMSSITNTSGVTTTRPVVARTNAATTESGLYHWDVLDAGLTADSYSTSRSSAQIASSANFPEFDFTGTWTIATSVPDFAGVAPVPRFACGRISGLVCP